MSNHLNAKFAETRIIFKTYMKGQSLLISNGFSIVYIIQNLFSSLTPAKEMLIVRDAIFAKIL